MKKLLCYLTASVLLVTTACGNGTKEASSDESEKVTSSTAASSTVSEETETMEPTQETDNAETAMKQQYEELLAEYPAQDSPVMLYGIPREGQTQEFYFSDTVVRVEEVGGTNMDGNHVIFYVKCENEGNNLVMLDWESDFQFQNDLGWDFYDALDAKETETGKQSIFVYDETPVPEAGSPFSYTAKTEIVNVSDTGIIYDTLHYYEIENTSGIKNLAAVPEANVLIDTCKPGSWENGEYYNENFNMKLSAQEYEYSFTVTSGLGVDPYSQVAITDDICLKGVKGVNDLYLHLSVYQFPEEITEEKFEDFRLCCARGVFDEKEEICGYEYNRYKCDYDGSEGHFFLWLRYEGNIIYVIDTDPWCLEYIAQHQ